MSNEQQRRASGAANAANRRASDGAAERRSGGSAMIERRTGQSQVAEINAVVAPPRPRKTLKPWRHAARNPRKPAPAPTRQTRCAHPVAAVLLARWRRQPERSAPRRFSLKPSTAPGCFAFGRSPP